MLSSLVWWHSRVRLSSRKPAIRLWHALSCVHCQDFGRFDKNECVSGGARCGAVDSGSQRLAALRRVECGVNEARSAPAHRPAVLSQTSVSACDPSSPVAFSVTQFASPLVPAVPALVRIRHKMLAFLAVDTVCVTVLQSV